MKFIKQSIPDVVLIQPNIHYDDRGYFVETFRQDLLEKMIGYVVNFVQDNQSKSTQGVLRGLHYQQPPYGQSKLVKVINGRVLDVAVDIRKDSHFFGQHVSVELNEDNQHQLFIPKGFAHGFVVLSQQATFAYKVDNYYAPEYEKGIAFDDEQLNINWQLPTSKLIISDKDKELPLLSQ